MLEFLYFLTAWERQWHGVEDLGSVTVDAGGQAGRTSAQCSAVVRRPFYSQQLVSPVSNRQLQARSSGFVVMCDFCDESFSKTYNLKVHLRRKHGIGETPKCPKCGAKFRSQLRLRIHSSSCPST
jgi:hypothetical protein